MWSLKESYNRLSQSKWDALFKSFELSKDVIEFNSSMILLKNSNGIEFNTIIGTYSVDLINKYRFFDYISPEVVDLCSKIDLLTLHLFGSDLKNHYIFDLKELSGVLYKIFFHLFQEPNVLHFVQYKFCLHP